MMSEFRMPEEELWVKQVLVGDEEATNRFMVINANNPAVRGIQITGMASRHGSLGGISVLVTYELNLKAKKEEIV